MSEENIKGIPEEETAELQNEEIAETAEEISEETAEEISEETNEEISEVVSEETTEETVEENSDETVSEEEADKTVEEETSPIDEDKLCLCCGEREKSEDGDYCEECEAEMLSRKIPFTAWICGLAAVVFSVFALALVFVLTAPSLQVAKADDYAKENRWYSAYTEYSNVDSVISELTTILGGDSPFLKTGSKLAVKKFDALAHYTSPLEAFYYEGTSVEHLEGKSIGNMKEYYQIYNDYLSSYDIVLTALETKFGTSSPTAEEMHAVVEGLRGTEGVSDIWVDYYHLTFVYNYNESDEEALKYLKAIDESAKKTKLDYSWLYYTEIADLLYKNGDYEGSSEYLDKLIEKDHTNFGAYELQMRITMKNDGLDEAKKLLDEFIEHNEGLDTAYVLEIMYLRCAKEYDKAIELCTEAIEEYGSSPEINRQLALIHLLKGDYGTAYESAFAAYSNAIYIAQYYQDESSLTNQLYNTLYLCAYMESENGTMTTQNASQITQILADLKDFVDTQSVLDIVNGTKTPEQILTEGEFDLV